MTPVVSVVIATRDRPALLRRAMQSIQSQGGVGPIEIVVVFDQTDIDLSVERNDETCTIRAVKNERTPGLAGARNSGILEASAPVVAFCDDDDEWLPGKLAAQLALLEANPDASLITCGIHLQFDDRVTTRIPDPDHLDRPSFIHDRTTEVHPSSFVVPAAMFAGPLGLVDEDLPGSYAEDYDLLLRAADCGPILAVPHALVTVHWHARSFFAERWRTIDEALGYLVDKHPDFHADPVGLARVRGQQAFAKAGAGDGAGARAMARDAWRLSKREKRAPLAYLVSTGIISAEQALRLAHRAGRGI